MAPARKAASSGRSAASAFGALAEVAGTAVAGAMWARASRAAGLKSATPWASKGRSKRVNVA